METKRHPLLQRLGIATGILLLLSFFMPILDFSFNGGGVNFINFTVWGEDEMPWVFKIYMLLPLICGILAIIGHFNKQHTVRAALYLIAGFIPAVLIWLLLQGELAPQFLGGMGRGISMNRFTGGALGWVALLVYYLGLLGMLTAAFAGTAHRESRTIPTVAMVGGVLMCLAMVIPLSGGRGFTLLLTAPFQTMADDPLTGIVLFVFNGLHIIAAIQCILWGRNHRDGAHFAKPVRRIIASAYLMLVLLGVIALGFAVIFSRVNRGGDYMFFFIVLLYAKIIMMSLGFFYAKSLGIAELLAHRPPHLDDRFA